MVMKNRLFSIALPRGIAHYSNRTKGQLHLLRRTYHGTTLRQTPTSARPTQQNFRTQNKVPIVEDINIAAAVEGSKKATQYVSTQIQNLDKQMNYHGYHTLRWIGAFLGLSGLTVYLYREEITESIGTTGADITSRTLGDEAVQREARELARGFVYELLNDKKALALTTEFLNTLMGREYTRDAVIQLLSNVVAEKETKIYLADILQQVLSDPVFIANVAVFVQQLAARDTTKQAMTNLFLSIFQDPDFIEQTAVFFTSVMESDTFKKSATSVATETAHATLNDEALQTHALLWVQNALRQPELHNRAGDAIWGAIRSTFIPGFLGGGKSVKPSDFPTMSSTEIQEEEITLSTSTASANMDVSGNAMDTREKEVEEPIVKEDTKVQENTVTEVKSNNDVPSVPLETEQVTSEKKTQLDLRYQSVNTFNTILARPKIIKSTELSEFHPHQSVQSTTDTETKVGEEREEEQE